jgi:cobalt/nickel transport system ATP-binding protein
VPVPISSDCRAREGRDGSKDPLLRLADVHFDYEGGIPALSGLSLSVAPGDRLAVLGANGCGKSTLLRLLAGLIFPKRGTYNAFGREITDGVLADSHFGMFFRKEVGILFQNVEAQLFNTTVAEEIAFGPLQMNETGDEVARKVRAAADAFRLGPLLDRPPFALSGGEKRRVALAAVMALDPSVLLLDEPTAGLDPRSSSSLADLILEAGEGGKTVVTATHDLHIVQGIATRVLVIGEDRTVLATGTPEEILCDRQLLLAANLVHRHRHAHEAYWHEHDHDHADLSHSHEHDRVQESARPAGGPNDGGRTPAHRQPAENSRSCCGTARERFRFRRDSFPAWRSSRRVPRRFSPPKRSVSSKRWRVRAGHCRCRG